jgi:tRNA threonylcarbamoyl adenosine modification protein YjeE
MEYKISSIKETKNLAEKIAVQIKIGQVILLKGTLGVGKTCFANFLINKLLKNNNLPETNIVSPTFNIVKEYKLKEYSVYHFDLYRLKNSNELYELDIENAFENGISIIEWPEKAEKIIYNIVFEIEIKIEEDNKRKFYIKEIKQ